MHKNIMDFEHPTQGGNLRPQYTNLGQTFLSITKSLKSYQFPFLPQSV